MKKIIVFFLMISVFCGNAQTLDGTGKKQGYWKKKDEKTGNLLYEGEFKDNKPIGVFKHYYPGDTAKRAVTYYKDGGKIAYTSLYHQRTGKIMAKGKYINELKDSVWNFYDEAGVLISKDVYKLGKKDGKCLVFFAGWQLSRRKKL
jgi:antitoxin component YwqK of YwqJK toxin-antitoxin module